MPCETSWAISKRPTPPARKSCSSAMAAPGRSPATPPSTSRRTPASGRWSSANSAALTCLANDFGYEHVFAKQVEYHGRAGDILIAISSSGKSANILNAVKAARGVGMTVVTFSGFDSGNPLRILGDINFYVPSSEYGFVELAHAILLHAVTDALTVGRTKPEAA